MYEAHLFLCKTENFQIPYMRVLKFDKPQKLPYSWFIVRKRESELQNSVKETENQHLNVLSSILFGYMTADTGGTPTPQGFRAGASFVTLSAQVMRYIEEDYILRDFLAGGGAKQ